MAAASCFICGGGRRVPSTRDYLACLDCGHEVLRGGQSQTFMINDKIDPSRRPKPDLLVRFQSSVVEKARKSRRLLVDIGSGSGKFLFHNRAAFASLLGVEVTPENVRYATEVLGLPVRTSLPDDLPAPSVVTFWHSLEHIPVEAMDAILGKLSGACDAESRVVISVPNNRSLQYQWFREGYAYYDAPNHLHQFSPQSLDRLMRRHGFKKTKTFFSPAYIVFGYVQGVLNLIMPIHNYFYYRSKRGADFGFSRPKLTLLDFINSIMLIVAIPISLILSLADFLLSQRRGVLTTCYRKTA